MKVILLQDIEGLGKKYEVKEVKNGYARNFLIPKKWAQAATKQALKWLAKQKEMIEKNIEEVGNFIGDMSYIILKIANICNIDAEKESLKVLEEYEKRFPVEKAKGNHGNVRAGGIDLK